MLVKELIKAIKITVFLWMITAVIYPSFLLIFGQLIVPFQANGSLIKNVEGTTIIGSSLIGQNFTEDKYFWSRPSVINYSSGEIAGKTGISGASNFAATNPQLIGNIKSKIENLQSANTKPTADLVYTSASGLDPHISIESARNQINRVATVRNLEANKVELLMTKATESRFLGIFGEPRVNVLKLNIELDNQS